MREGRSLSIRDQEEAGRDRRVGRSIKIIVARDLYGSMSASLEILGGGYPMSTELASTGIIGEASRIGNSGMGEKK